MQVLIAFLFACFLLGGTRHGQILLRRPVLMIVACVILAGSYYSIRIIQ
jgi:hypothetical protein